MNPIGVGFLDLNPEGLFHLERMRLREDFRCLAGCREGNELTNAHGLLEQVARSPQELIDDPRIELLWIGPEAGPALVGSALNAGKHVLIGVPLDGKSASEQYWKSDEAGPAARAKLFVAALHRWDGQFQVVLQLVRRGDLGQLSDVRKISRQYVPFELGMSPTGKRPPAIANLESMPAQQPDFRLQQTKWFEMLDELLQLVPEPVVSVFAHHTGRLPTQVNQARGGWVSILFANGCQAWLELNRHSLAPLETGWVMEGTEAGFADGKRYQSGPDYELIDVPVEDQSTDQTAFYDALVATIRHGDDFPVTTKSVQTALTLLEAINRRFAAVQVPAAEDLPRRS